MNMQILSFYLVVLVESCFCLALTTAFPPSRIDPLTPPLQNSPISFNDTLTTQLLPPHLICANTEPGDMFRQKLHDEDCRPLIDQLSAKSGPFKFPQPHKTWTTHYRSCFVKVHSGAQPAPFPETLAIIGHIVNEIMISCRLLRFGGSRVDFMTGWQVSLYSPRGTTKTELEDS